MHTTLGALIDITGINLNEKLLGTELGIETMQIGVFGGILIGFLTAYLYNRFHKVELPDSISLFSGERLVPIVSSFGAILSAVVLYFIWPPVGNGILFWGTILPPIPTR